MQPRVTMMTGRLRKLVTIVDKIKSETAV